MLREPPLVFSDVTAGYGSRTVLSGLGLEVPQGGICALLGRNGAGKTTLLRTALGFLKVRSGTVRVLGDDAWAHRFGLKDKIGFVAERQDLWPRMRGTDLIRLASRLYAQWDEALVASLADRYGLALDQTIGTYSHGMQVQLAQIVALAHRPEVLILDEPVSGMDPVVRSEFTEHVLGYVHDTGATVLYSTHLVDEVQDMADRVAFLHGGTIILQGAVGEVLEQYTRLVVALDEAEDASLTTLGPVSVHRHHDLAVLTVAAPPKEVISQARTLAIGIVEARRPTLQELFIGLLGEDNPLRDGSHAARHRTGVTS